jgi:WhiB family redox-sensing transcriptional regulator
MAFRPSPALTPRDRPEWMDRGECKKRSSLFFPGEHALADVIEAKRICHECPVEGECLRYALDYREIYGVWGGTSAEQRIKMMRQGVGR